jgi:hypothetical protein
VKVRTRLLDEDEIADTHNVRVRSETGVEQELADWLKQRPALSAKDAHLAVISAYYEELGDQ